VRRLALLALSSAFPVLACQAPVVAQPSSTFSIEAQPLEAALLSFAAQAHAALSLPTGGFGGLQSRRVKGIRKAEDALARLLAGSGYTFESVGAGAYRVVAVRPARPPLPPPSGTPKPDVIIVSAHIPATEAELPRDVSRVGGERLVDAGVSSDSGLAAEISGLTFTNLGIGRNKILLRGLSDGALSGRTQSLVGLYYGDTRITYGAPDPDLQLVDIASVEVLRGPQGALYGAGAIAGIMRINPAAVDLNHFGGSVLLSADGVEGGDPGRNAELVVNAPILPGAVGVRGVFYNQHEGGWLDNQRIGAKNSNSVERSGARVTALAQINPSWSVEIGVTSQGITNDDSQYLEQTSSGLLRDAALLEPHDNDFNVANITIRGSTEWGDLTSSTSHVRHRFGSRFDATGAFPTLGAAPGNVQPLDEQDALGIWVHETRLASASDAATPWFIGVFYADGDNSRHVTLRDGAYGAWSGVDYQEVRSDAVDELALFGEASWRLGSRLSFSTGLRIFRSQLKMQSVTAEPGLGLNRAESGALTSSGVAPDLRLSYQASPHALFYLSAAKGYRADGFNSGGLIGQTFSTSVQPFARYGDDDIWTYEAGARVDLLQNRLALRLTGFHSEWRNVQTDELVSNGFTYTANVGDARTTGLEFDGRYEPIDGLALRLYGLINEPEVNRTNPSFSPATDDELPGSPEYSGGASVRYAWSASAGPVAVRFSAELSGAYVGRSNLGFGNGLSIGDYFESDLRLSASVRSWQGELYIDNLGNSDGSTYSLGNPYQAGRVLRTPLRPRTLGVRLRRTF
jgi:outer membrane receptor protein involved in Fe transport